MSKLSQTTSSFYQVSTDARNTCFKAFVYFLLILVACSNTTTIYYADNPNSAVLACDPAILPVCSGYPAGDVCHVAIAGGTCAPSCATQKDPNGYCAGLEPGAGLVCHPQVGGGECAPPCSTPQGTSVDGYLPQQICNALAPNLACGSNGLCSPVVVSPYANLRVFNGDPSSIGNGGANSGILVYNESGGFFSTGVQPVPFGGLYPVIGYQSAPGGTDRILIFNLGADPDYYPGTTLIDPNSVPAGTDPNNIATAYELSLNGGYYYTLVYANDGSGNPNNYVHLITETTEQPPPGANSVWLQWVHLIPGGSLNLRADSTGALPAGPWDPAFLTIFSGYADGQVAVFSALDLPVSASGAAGPVTFAVSSSPLAPPANLGNVTLAPHTNYLAITWPENPSSAEFGLIETTILAGPNVVTSPPVPPGATGPNSDPEAPLAGIVATFQSSAIRLANALADPNSPPVAITLTGPTGAFASGPSDGILLNQAASMPFTVTDYVAVPAGSYAVTTSFQGIGTNLGSLNPPTTAVQSLAAANAYTVLGYGSHSNGNDATLWLTDTPLIAGAPESIRFANVALFNDANGYLGDLLVGPSGPSSPTPLITAVPLGGVSAYVPIDLGANDMLVGQLETVSTMTTFDFPQGGSFPFPGSAYTAVMADQAPTPSPSGPTGPVSPTFVLWLFGGPGGFSH